MDRPLAPKGWRSRSHRLVQGLLPVTLIGMVFSFTGCAYTPNLYETLSPYGTECQCLTDIKYRMNARSVWREKYEHCYGNRANAKDIKQGFIDGYVDTANGGSGCPPLIAPRRCSVLSCLTNRKPAASFWFEGYPLGVVAAETYEVECCYQSRLNPRLLACMQDQGCRAGCRPCTPAADCQCGQPGCNGGCAAHTIFGTTNETIRNGLTDSDGAVVIEHSTAPVPVPTETIDATVPSNDLPMPVVDTPQDAVPEPQPLKDVDADRVSEVVPIEPADEQELQANAVPGVVEGPVEMPNMQVRFDFDDSEWMFGDVDLARSLLQIDATSELDTAITSDTTN